MFTSRASRLTSGLALAALAGCGAQAGGQTGEETEGQCTFRTTALGRDEPSPLGFAPEHVLAYAAGAHEASFDWLEDPSLSYGPEHGSSELTVELSGSGPARFARVDPERSAGPCRDQVRIPVALTLSTAGGALAESVMADLIATSADEAVVTGILPGADVKGSLAFDPTSLGARRFVRLELNLGFGPEKFAGYLLAGIEAGDSSGNAGGSVSFQPLPLACWGEVAALHYVCSK